MTVILFTCTFVLTGQFEGIRQTLEEHAAGVDP